MNAGSEEFTVGALYSNEEIFRGLSVGNAGGIRVKIDPQANVERAAVFTSIPTPRQLAENPYHDRLEGCVLTYTGTGRAGNQSMGGINARLQQQVEQRFPIYGFVQVADRRSASVGNKRWRFMGLLEYMRCASERQIDSNGQPRLVWVYEFQVHTDPAVVVVAIDRQMAIDLHSTRGIDLPDAYREVLMSVQVAAAEDTDEELVELDVIRRRLLALEPRAFELFVRDLLLHTGFEDVVVTRYSQDGGIDLSARPGANAWAVQHLVVQLQAKRWLHTVGRREVAELRGSLLPHAAGCIVTTSHFSRAALQESKDSGKVPIAVVDGDALARLVRRTRFNCAT